MMCPYMSQCRRFSGPDFFFIYFTPIINHHRHCGFGTTPQYFAICAISHHNLRLNPQLCLNLSIWISLHSLTLVRMCKHTEGLHRVNTHKSLLGKLSRLVTNATAPLMPKECSSVSIWWIKKLQFQLKNLRPNCHFLSWFFSFCLQLFCKTFKSNRGHKPQKN